MSDPHHDLVHATHTHDGKPIQNDEPPPLEAEVLETSVRELLMEKGVISAEEIREMIEVMDGRNPALGAKIIARAWADDDFRKLLLENGRVAVLPEISEQFEALKAKVENSIDAVITAAAPLSAAQEKEIAGTLAEKLGRDVRISTEIDENLIGGAVVRAGDVVIDGSLRARLEGLANALTK